MELNVPVKGGEVWAEDTGGEGIPLVLLHPGVAASGVWDAIVPPLAERHRVIRYDVRGYGRSPAPGAEYTPAGDLLAVLDHFGVERAVLVGSSMGGATALSLALDAPGRVAGLALFCPGVTGDPALQSGELLADIGELTQKGDLEGIVALGLRTWGAAGTGDDPEAAAQLRAAIPGWFNNLGHQLPDPDAFDRLGEITVPCLVAVGEHDHERVIRSNEAVAARIPGCRLVRLPGSDHFPSLREPGRVARLTQELYDSVR
ncbi:alpha/beta fold hydrolase [Streptomyces sp. NBC_00083]|uniref:alpha/beta fold hydrolase n=1 Tax=Streptomyces sp. NBC_00083 TaxID=2975647 RepID=UPI00225335A8|nr:alpha/beta hydrolase [Streptomyces sp. NBC_00083]MCX5386149.1 alpha/beta hydrolase [Streptomyces sp. NBC_00083]